MDAICPDCLYCEERPNSNLRRRPWCRLWEIWEPQERAVAWCEFGAREELVGTARLVGAEETRP